MADDPMLQTVLESVADLRDEVGFGFTDVRAEMRTLRNDVQDLHSRLTILFDELAAFWQDSTTRHE